MLIKLERDEKSENVDKNVFRNVIKIFLILFAIFFAIYLTPAIWSDLAYISNAYDETLKSYESMHDNFINKNKYESREEELILEKNKLNVLDSINQENIIKIIHDHSSNLGIVIDNYNFSEVFPLLQDEQAIENLYVINVNIDFYSNFEDLILFIDALQNDEINMSITNLHSSLNEDNFNLVEMDMKFYALIY